MSDTDNGEIARRFYGAVERRDYAAVAAIYADDVQIWHNIDDIVQTRQQNLDELRAIGAAASAISYDLGRRIDFATGFVQLSTVHVALHDGSKTKVALCGIFEIAGGRVTRLDEYFDSVPFKVVEDAE